jgi:hypothetical protein
MQLKVKNTSGIMVPDKGQGPAILITVNRDGEHIKVKINLPKVPASAKMVMTAIQEQYGIPFTLKNVSMVSVFVEHMTLDVVYRDTGYAVAQMPAVYSIKMRPIFEIKETNILTTRGSTVIDSGLTSLVIVKAGREIGSAVFAGEVVVLRYYNESMAVQPKDVYSQFTSLMMGGTQAKPAPKDIPQRVLLQYVVEDYLWKVGYEKAPKPVLPVSSPRRAVSIL